MNETEYISDVSTLETFLSDYQASEYSPSVTEIIQTSDISNLTTETTLVSTVDYDIKHIQQNSDGILLMVTGIFFLLVISGISKIVGHFLSM